MIFKLKYYTYFLIVLIVACNGARKNNSDESDSAQIIFEDSFGKDSQGEYVENVIHLPPPEGLGYTWEVLPGGHIPVNWIHSDSREVADPLKGFWVIPSDSGYLHQGGRSRNSVLFANKPIPKDITNYNIEFRQKRGDNDKIMYVLGASEPKYNMGYEIGYEIQVPGTDSTTTDAYIYGNLNDSTIVKGAAFQNVWVKHRIEVRGEYVKWVCNDILMAEGKIEGLKPGYFGIRQRYERNTLYDDFKITVLKHNE